MAHLTFLGLVNSDLRDAWRGKKGWSFRKTQGRAWRGRGARVPAQTTLASSQCWQLWRAQPAWAQRPSASSVPAQRTWLSPSGTAPRAGAAAS